MSNIYKNQIRTILDSTANSDFIKLLNDKAYVIFLYGAGQLGKKYYKILNENGISVKGFIVDQDYIPKIETDFHITTLDKAIETHKSNLIVISTICNSNFNFKTFFDKNRRVNIFHFSLLNYFLNSKFGDYYFFSDSNILKENLEKISNAFSILNSDDSKNEFVRHLKFRNSFNFDFVNPVSTKLYFPHFLSNRINSHFHYIDCGGYTGDTVMLFENDYGIKFEEITVFEPDPNNFKTLLHNIKSISDARKDVKLAVINKAISDTNKQINFSSSASEGSKISIVGNISIEAVSLEQFITKSNTFIKFDIEGEEIIALKGIENAIKKYKPIMAISAYHNPADLWEIPMLIHSINPDYKIELVLEGTDGMGLVYYAY